MIASIPTGLVARRMRTIRTPSEVFNGWYWTSRAAAISPAHAWYVALDGARMFYGGKDQSFMPVRTANSVTAPCGLNPASKYLPLGYWSISPACSGSAARTSHCNQWSGTRHWQRRPGLIRPAPQEGPGGRLPSMSWRRWWIAPPTAQPCRLGIASPTYRTSTGRPPACSSLIGLGLYSLKKSQRASVKSGLPNFRYGPWQRSIESWARSGHSCGLKQMDGLQPDRYKPMIHWYCLHPVFVSPRIGWFKRSRSLPLHSR